MARGVAARGQKTNRKPPQSPSHHPDDNDILSQTTSSAPDQPAPELSSVQTATVPKSGAHTAPLVTTAPHGLENHQSLPSITSGSRVSKKVKPPWSAFARYKADTSGSAPQHGDSSATMKNNLRSINASVGPRNTMSQTAPSQTDTDNRPAKRQKHDSPTTSSFFIDLPRSKLSSDVLPRPAPAKAARQKSSSGIPTFSTPALVKSPRSRPKPRANGPKAIGEQRRRLSIQDPIVDSLDSESGDGVAHAADATTRSRKGASPDEIGIEDPAPAAIISDLMPRASRVKKRYSAKLLIAEQQPKFKRPRSGSPDELQELSTKRRIPADIPKTTFDRDTNSRASSGKLRVVRAVSGAYYYNSKDPDQPPIYLRSSADVFTATDKEDRQLVDMEWLAFNVGKLRKIHYAAGSLRSPYIQLQRPQLASKPGTLMLELADPFAVEAITDLAVGYQHADIDAVRLDRMMKAAMGEAQKRRTSRDKEPTNTTRAATFVPPSTAAKSTETAGSVQLRSTADDKRRTSLPSPELTTRRTRRSSPALSVDDYERWTATNSAWRKNWHQSLVYPPTGKNRTTVDQDDIPRLDDGEFLNDNLINFYLRHLMNSAEAKQPGISKRVYVFSTFFFEKLKSGSSKINYDGIKSWTAKVDLFSYDYVIVPVNENLHWYLAVICNMNKILPTTVTRDDSTCAETSRETSSSMTSSLEKDLSSVKLTNGKRNSKEEAGREEQLDSPAIVRQEGAAKSLTPKKSTANSPGDPLQPRIVTLDSLGSTHSPTCTALRAYIAEEAKNRHNVELTVQPAGLTARSIPQQNNYCDCGVYVLAYAERFLKDPDNAAKKLILKEDLGWTVEPSAIRSSVRDLVFKLQSQQQEEAEREKEAKKQKRKDARLAKALSSVPPSSAPSPNTTPDAAGTAIAAATPANEDGPGNDGADHGSKRSAGPESGNESSPIPEPCATTASSDVKLVSEEASLEPGTSEKVRPHSPSPDNVEDPKFAITPAKSQTKRTKIDGPDVSAGVDKVRLIDPLPSSPEESGEVQPDSVIVTQKDVKQKIKAERKLEKKRKKEESKAREVGDVIHVRTSPRSKGSVTAKQTATSPTKVQPAARTVTSSKGYGTIIYFHDDSPVPDEDRPRQSIENQETGPGAGAKYGGVDTSAKLS